MNGGYIMLDCTGLDLIKGSTPQTVTGIFERVKEAIATGKPIMAVNCTWGVLPVTPLFTFAIQFDANTIICTASTLQIIITSSDVITINNLVE